MEMLSIYKWALEKRGRGAGQNKKKSSILFRSGKKTKLFILRPWQDFDLQPGLRGDRGRPLRAVLRVWKYQDGNHPL